MFVPGDITNIQTGFSNDNLTSYPVPSATYNQDVLYLAWVSSKSGGAFVEAPVPTLTGGGLTWTQIATDTIALPVDNTMRITAFRAVPSANTTNAITLGFGASQQDWVGWTIVQVTNANITSGGANAVVQSKTYVQDVLNPSFTMDAATGPESLVISGFGANGSSTAWTAGTNETEIAQTFRSFSQFNLVQDITVDCTTNATNEKGSVALEIASSTITTPDQFTFTDVTDAEFSTLYQDSQPITGPTDGVTLTVTDGEVSNNNGLTWSPTSVTMVTGQTLVRATVTSSDQPLTAVTQTPVVNGVSDTFSVTTKDAEPERYRTDHFITAPLFKS